MDARNEFRSILNNGGTDTHTACRLFDQLEEMKKKTAGAGSGSFRRFCGSRKRKRGRNMVS